MLFNECEIVAVGGEELNQADNIIDAEGALLFPGIIDAHVHFREPGITHKADIASESRAALAGGVTSFFDMPNTVPQTTTVEAWREKMERAKLSSVANYAFFPGLTEHNINEILNFDFSLIPGVKVFLGSSTGGMLVSDCRVLDTLFANVKAPIVVHAEDESVIAKARNETLKREGNDPHVRFHSEIRPVEACVKATEHALELLSLHPSAHLHIAHLSTSEEVELVKKAKKQGLNVTCEVSPHHLLFSTDDYQRLGSRIKMNPSVKEPRHREALRQGVREGVIDIIATDHAPHLLSEKEGNALTAVSGAPMVQFSLAVALELFDSEIVLRTMCEGPARVFGVEGRGKIAPGYAPEMVLLNRIEQGYTITDSDVLSKCGWTPLNGRTLHHRVHRTILPHPSALRFRHNH